MEKKCIFCLISKGDSPAELLVESSKSLAFSDVSPLSKGHSLVITKNHYQNLFEVEQSDWNDLLSTIKILKDRLIANYSPKGFNLITNVGKDAYQSINHFHFHLIPKYEKDAGFVWPDDNY